MKISQDTIAVTVYAVLFALKTVIRINVGEKQGTVMLAEGFLRILQYREERKLASASARRQTHSHCIDPGNSTVSGTDTANAGKESNKMLQ